MKAKDYDDVYVVNVMTYYDAHPGYIDVDTIAHKEFDDYSKACEYFNRINLRAVYDMCFVNRGGDYSVKVTLEERGSCKLKTLLLSYYDAITDGVLVSEI